MRNSYNEGALKPIVDKCISAFNGIKTKSVKFNGIKETVGEKLSSIGDAANGIKSKIAEKFTSVKPQSLKICRNKTSVITALAPVKNVISEIVNDVKATVGKVIDGIKINIRYRLKYTNGNIKYYRRNKAEFSNVL